MSFDKLTTLHKHTSRTSGRVKNFTLVRLDNFNYGTDNTGRRIELTAFLTFFAGKFSKEILIYTPKYIASFRTGKMQVVFKYINYITQAAFIKLRSGIVFGKNTFKLLILFLQCFHCRIHNNSNFSSK